MGILLKKYLNLLFVTVACYNFPLAEDMAEAELKEI